MDYDPSDLDPPEEEYLGADLGKGTVDRIIFHMWAIFVAVYAVEFLGWLAQIAWTAREKALGN